VIGYVGVFVGAGAIAAAGLILALTLTEPRRLASAPEPTVVGQPGTTP
jgi:hypothetical protein